jgi:hypothetical protein
MLRRKREKSFFAVPQGTSIPMLQRKPKAFNLRPIGKLSPKWAAVFDTVKQTSATW